MFIQIMQGKCTRQAELRAALDRWRTDCEPHAEGWLGGTYGFTDDDVFVGVVRFESEEAARRNSQRPEQDQWWRETRTLFDGDVEFHDCSDVSLMLGGGSDDAGFVQVVRGKVDEPARMREMFEGEGRRLREIRPEIIGATLAIEDDGSFTETVAFTDETSARENEAKEVPADMADWEARATAHDLEFLDLHHPFFTTHGEATRG